METFLAVLATCFAFALTATGAEAQATRIWVSGVGDDANPCSRTAPCRTFAGAIPKTAIGVLTGPGVVARLEIIAGHGRVEAAKLLGIKRVPTLALAHLSDVERRAYVLADNKLALNAGWDREILAIELQVLVDLEFETELTGFSLAEIDLVLDEAGDADPDGSDAPEDLVPVVRIRRSPSVGISGCLVGTGCCAATRATRPTWAS